MVGVRDGFGRFFGDPDKRKEKIRGSQTKGGVSFPQGPPSGAWEWAGVCLLITSPKNERFQTRKTKDGNKEQTRRSNFKRKGATVFRSACTCAGLLRKTEKSISYQRGNTHGLEGGGVRWPAQGFGNMDHVRSLRPSKEDHRRGVEEGLGRRWGERRSLRRRIKQREACCWETRTPFATGYEHNKRLDWFKK